MRTGLEKMSDLLNDISEQTAKDYDRLREDSGRLDLVGISLVALSGDDRKGWLQGQVTNDVRRLESGNSTSFCLCSATGQIQAVVDAWAVRDRILMTTPHETLPAVLRRAEEMVVVEDVAAEEVGSTFRLLSIQGPTASRRLADLLHLPSLDAGESRFANVEVLCLRSDRTGMGGWDVWFPSSATSAIEEMEKAFQPIGHEAYNIARLEAGIPFYGSDFGDRTLPPELGPGFESKHVSYSKGCYMGQEVLMRIHSRGHTNKQWVGLVAEGPLELGATVTHPLRNDAGTITSAAFSPDFGYIGAAILRNEVSAERERVRVVTERGEVDAEVRAMPILRLG